MRRRTRPNPSHLASRNVLGGMLLGLVGLLAGCSGEAHYPINPKLERYDPNVGYRIENIARDPGNSRVMLLVLMVSGGGTRAAALAYGALEALRDSKVVVGGRDTNLLDEVDYVTAVSGGSVTAAYFGLRGNRIFDEFPDKFLYRDVESELRGELWSSLPRIRSDRFGRGDLLSRYFDERVFNKATYADLAKRARPFIVINATDLSIGGQFSFTQTYFDLLCSDLSGVPVGRAVAASASLPLFFSPITLWNYAGSCGFEPPPWFSAEPDDPRLKRELDNLRTYTDAGKRPHIHLLDGGLLDNLALRQAVSTVYRRGGFAKTLDMLGYGDASDIVFISVDAEREPNFRLDASPNTPSLAEVSRAIGAVLIQSSFEASLLAEQSSQQWYDELMRRRKPGAPELNFYFIDVALRGVADPVERRRYMDIPTAFTLQRQDVDDLRGLAGRLLAASPEYQSLMRNLQVHAAAAAASAAASVPR